MGLTVGRWWPRVRRLAGHALRLPVHVVPLLAHPVQTVRMWTSADMRRAFPLERDRTTKRLLIVGTPTAALVAAFVPVVRLPLLGVIAVEVVAALGYRWWNGPRALARRGLPPGRITILPQPLVDDRRLPQLIARHGRVFTTNMLRHPTVGVDIERGTSLLREQHACLGTPERPDNHVVTGGFVRNQVGERHRQTRAALAIALSPAAVESMRPGFAAAIDRHLDHWFATPSTAGFDPQQPCRHLVRDAWITALLGVDPTRDAPLHGEIAGIAERFDSLYPDRSDRAELARLGDIAAELARGADRLAPSAVRSLAERAPDALDDPVVLANVVHLLHTSRHDVAGLVVWLVYELAHHPEWTRRIRGAGDDEALPAQVVAETLRLHQSEYVIRETVCPVAVDGFTVPPGWWVRVMVRETHRDGAVFTEPERFDPDRFAGAPPPRHAYAPFGLDGRSCIGESLTRTFAAHVVTSLSRRGDLAVVADGPPILSDRRFWAPSPDFRVRLVP